jgi:predicted PurR-regulated permease PerM
MIAERIVNKYLTGFFILALAAFLFLGVKQFFSAFLGAVIFYVLFKRFMLYLTVKKQFKKPLAAILIILISFIMVILPLGLLIGMILNKVLAVAKHPEQIKHYFETLSSKVSQLPFDVSPETIGPKVAAFISSNAGGVIGSTFNIAASLLIMYFLLYFLLMNVTKLEETLLKYLPFDQARTRLFGKELETQTFANSICVPAVAVAQGLAVYISLLIAGVPEAGMLSLIAAFASVIPIVGCGLVWVPVALYLFANNQIWQGAFVTGYSALVLITVENGIRMVVARRLGNIHPVATVFGVILGLKFFGVPGLVFGPLLIIYLLLLIRIYHDEYKSSRIIES